MFATDHLEVWNLSPNGRVFVGAQKIFNIVGRLKALDESTRFLYRLNNGPEKRVFFNSTAARVGRLINFGDFNIDTLEASDLRPQNDLAFRLFNGSAKPRKYKLSFSTQPFIENSPCFRLNLNGVDYPQQIGQVVDGKWRVGRGKSGEPCLEIRREDAGLDRIILFGHHNWTTGYEITARLCVTDWTESMHSVGLIFKWNPHLTGDGTCLPMQWSTGFGYFYSHCPGLRIRFGVDVHFDIHGTKVGNYILQERNLCRWRRWVGHLGNVFFYKYLPFFYPFSQMVSGVQYKFRMFVHPEKYTFTVWKAGRKEPEPQIIVTNPIERLPAGAVGIIAHNSAARIYEFNVNPV